MLSAFFSMRKRLVVFLFFVGLVSACDPTLVPVQNNGVGKAQVALLLPSSSADSGVAALAASAHNAALLAVGELGENIQIDLRLYDTAGTSDQAATVAAQAVSDGADIIIGPLFAQAANAAGQAVAGRNVNVLSLSNNTQIAGGNVFVLGNTFDNTADRIIRYAASQGREKVLVVHAQNAAGEVGRDAILRALTRRGLTPVGVESYEYSQRGVVQAQNQIEKTYDRTGADLLFLTSDYDGALTLMAQLLPEVGVDPQKIQYAGLARWDALPSAFNIAGIKGGWFAAPDPTRTDIFTARYQAAYGSAPHPLAALAYDGVAAVGALLATGDPDPLGHASLTRVNGYQGASGIFRLRADGTVERGLAIASVVDGQITVVSPAPSVFGAQNFTVPNAVPQVQTQVQTLPPSE